MGIGMSTHYCPCDKVCVHCCCDTGCHHGFTIGHHGTGHHGGHGDDCCCHHCCGGNGGGNGGGCCGCCDCCNDCCCCGCCNVHRVAGSAAPPCVLHCCHHHGAIHKRNHVVAVPMGYHDDKAIIYVGHDDCCGCGCDCGCGCGGGHGGHGGCCHDDHCCHHHRCWGHGCHYPHVEYAGCDETHGHVIRVCRDCIETPDEKKTEKKHAKHHARGEKAEAKKVYPDGCMTLCKRCVLAIPMGYNDGKAKIYIGDDDDCCMRDCIRGPACEECVDDYGHEPYCNYGWGRCHSPRIEYAGCDDEHGNVLRVGFYNSLDEPMVDSLEEQSALMNMSKRHEENRVK